MVDYLTVSVEEVFALPVDLLTFSSELRDEQIFLSWKTSSEIDNKGFEIQRTEDFNQPYRNLGWVDGTNLANGSSYHFIDENVENGKTYYYRLKQLDLDESFSFSPVVSETCLLYTSPSPRDQRGSRMPSSA